MNNKSADTRISSWDRWFKRSYLFKRNGGKIKMFNFFEGLIEKLGVRLVSDFTEKLINFITFYYKLSKK